MSSGKGWKKSARCDIMRKMTESRARARKRYDRLSYDKPIDENNLI